MVKRVFYLVSAVLLLSLGTAFAGEDPPKPGVKPLQRSRPVKLFTGTFVNPAGRVHQIQIADGGYINIKNTQDGQFYRLWTRSGEEGTAEVTIERFLDADFSTMIAEERLDVPLDGMAKRSSLAPFRFTLDGVRKARAELRPGQPTQDKAIGGACCIDCGDGWEVCCGVAIFEPGWIACCWIDTSCAWCEVCAWWTQ